MVPLRVNFSLDVVFAVGFWADKWLANIKMKPNQLKIFVVIDLKSCFLMIDLKTNMTVVCYNDYIK
jgi:hypothetical protein